MNEGMRRALELIEEHHSDDHQCERCPVVRYVEYREDRSRIAR
jgi:hypothetical protein